MNQDTIIIIIHVLQRYQILKEENVYKDLGLT